MALWNWKRERLHLLAGLIFLVLIGEMSNASAAVRLPFTTIVASVAGGGTGGVVTDNHRNQAAIHKKVRMYCVLYIISS
jgi:hypothetical protein